ncbi:cytochrome aa3-600 menaquinol oxidase subunit 4 [Neobacillus niacini]|uniref:cytochrome aa3 quinol oxidase subunit IV n=1 Tax=Neobacillus driksii TaxID=3035913 RepID=UPI002787229F|nr:cytochrome aa3 quinol oxidase subunit IV [Neobacillus niacini]MDQ0970446.1 cytochrome aa3-600 menaquinol oxidase subunit 4 [Neobacillus niacini]
MKALFPLEQVMGFIFSIILTLMALCVYLFHLPFTVAMTILLITVFVQAGLQLVVFMHAGETEDKGAIYTNIYYALIIALVTIFGTLLCMIWGYL